MNFGDWEMFRVLIVSLREHEMTSVIKQSETRHVRAPALKPSSGPSRERKRNYLSMIVYKFFKFVFIILASVPKITSDKDTNKIQGDGSTSSSKNKQSVMEKQVRYIKAHRRH